LPFTVRYWGLAVVGVVVFLAVDEVVLGWVV
jgi:hypothetical protein